MAVTALSPVSQATATTTSLDSLAPSFSVTTETGGQDFLSVLGGMVQGVNNDLKHAEALSISALKGDKDVQVQDVVGAVMSAEQSLRMAVAVRDKIVSAYLDLSRMQI